MLHKCTIVREKNFHASVKVGKILDLSRFSKIMRHYLFFFFFLGNVHSVTAVSKRLGKIDKVVEKLHFRSRVDRWYNANCNPYDRNKL